MIMTPYYNLFLLFLHFKLLKYFFFVPFRLVDEGDFIETIKFNDSLTLSFGAGKFEFFKKMKSLW